MANKPIPVGATFPVPEVYRPYVNTAKKIYEQYAGIGVETKVAVAENQNYISVHMITDDFELVTYDSESTIYTATGIAFVTYDKRTDKWSAEVVDNTTTPSECSRYLSHWVWSEVDVTWNGATVFTNQEGWYYNSVKLPDVSDNFYVFDGTNSTLITREQIKEQTGYDLDSYPYVTMSYADLTSVKEGTYVYYALYTDVKFRITRIEDGKVYAAPSTSGNLFALFLPSKQYLTLVGVTDLMGDEWNVNAVRTIEANEEFGFEDSMPWGNYDVLNSDDSIYIAGSDPVHVTYVVEEEDPDEPDKPSYDELSFKIGLALGLCGKGLPEGLLLFGGGGYMFDWRSEDGFIETVESDGKYWAKISSTVPILTGNTHIDVVVDGETLVSEAGAFTEIEDNWYRHATTLVYVATGTNSKGLSKGIWYLSDSETPTDGYFIRLSKA